MLITPNNIQRPEEVDFKLEREADGIYTVKNVYLGKATYFEDEPLDAGDVSVAHNRV